jgi:hypothetical protein
LPSIFNIVRLEPIETTWKAGSMTDDQNLPVLRSMITSFFVTSTSTTQPAGLVTSPGWPQSQLKGLTDLRLGITYISRTARFSDERLPACLYRSFEIVRASLQEEVLWNFRKLSKFSTLQLILSRQRQSLFLYDEDAS